jgi:hypothetical protein
MEDRLMQIISAAGEMKAMLPDVGILSSFGVVPHARMMAQVTSSVAISRAATSGWINWDTVVTDNYGSFSIAVPARLYVPMAGWYLASVYLKTTTATSHDAALQIHSSALNSHIAYKKWFLPAASANYPNSLALNAVSYMTRGSYFYSNWGTSQTITSLTGVANIGFTIWKLS